MSTNGSLEDSISKDSVPDTSRKPSNIMIQPYQMVQQMQRLSAVTLNTQGSKSSSKHPSPISATKPSELFKLTSCMKTPSSCQKLRHLQIFPTHIQQNFHSGNSKEVVMNDMLKDKELLAKLQSLDVDSQRRMYQSTGMSQQEMKLVEVFRKISSQEKAKNLTWVLQNNRLNMPLTSFQLKLDQETQNKIYNRIPIEPNKNKPNVNPRTMTKAEIKKSRQRFDQISIAAGAQNKIREVQSQKSFPMYLFHQEPQNQVQEVPKKFGTLSKGTLKRSHQFGNEGRGKEQDFERNKGILISHEPESNLQTMKNAKLNRRAYLQSTLYLQKNFKKEIKDDIARIKPLINPLRYPSLTTKQTVMSPTSAQLQQRQQQEIEDKEQQFQKLQSNVKQSMVRRLSQMKLEFRSGSQMLEKMQIGELLEELGGDFIDAKMIADLESLSDRSYNIEKLEQQYFNENASPASKQNPTKKASGFTKLTTLVGQSQAVKVGEVKNELGEFMHNTSRTSSIYEPKKKVKFEKKQSKEKVILEPVTGQPMLSTAKMFESEKDFTNLRLGAKSTVFEKDSNINLKKRRGNFTIIKYSNFT